jgi:hypothetical protein
MTMLDDIDEGGFSESGALIRKTVPGYDYRRRRKGAETDRKVRDKVERDLGGIKKRLDSVSDTLYQRDKRDLVADIDELVTDVETLRQRIKTAAGGGGSVRDLAVEEEEALVSLVEYDASLIAQVEEIDAHVADLRDASDEGEAMESLIRECKQAVANLDHTFTQRQDYMEGLKR